ncbi:hypothetical protein CCP2SC5_90002 [Azospirillaceae bacterium]
MIRALRRKSKRNLKADNTSIHSEKNSILSGPGTVFLIAGSYKGRAKAALIREAIFLWKRLSLPMTLPMLNGSVQ